MRAHQGTSSVCRNVDAAAAAAVVVRPHGGVTSSSSSSAAAADSAQVSLKKKDGNVMYL